MVEQHLRYAEMVANRVLVMPNGRIGLKLSAEESRAHEAEVESMYVGGLVTDENSQDLWMRI